VLVCGGDGTVNSILGLMKKLEVSFPIAILPLGTGNDLAIALKWAGRGGGYVNDADDVFGVDTVLRRVKNAYPQKLDRWLLQNSYLGSFAILRGGLASRKSINFTNYFSCGVDAAAALNFHRVRTQNPWAFFSRLVNKIYYTLFGLRVLMFEEKNLDFKQIVTVTVDGKAIDIPDDAKGIIILNINSYAGGCKLWKDEDANGAGLSGGIESSLGGAGSNNGKESHFESRAIDDGLLEVVSINSALALGKWQLVFFDSLFFLVSLLLLLF
jgi:diacylglycerol kinase (ATP)